MTFPLLPFAKIEAAGNDFIVARRPNSTFDPPSFVRALCAPHTGVGADGVVFMNEGRDGWSWAYYNSDGSEAAMCGNATRAITLWFDRYHPNESKTYTWRTSTGRVEGRRLANDRAITRWEHASSTRPLPSPLEAELQKHLPKGFPWVGGRWVEAGVPHVVLVAKFPWSPELRASLGSKLRHHGALGPEGANVTFYSLSDGHCVSFERGVEGETLACGSGALAARRALESLGEARAASTKLIFPGGTLEVEARQGHLWVSGPVNLVYEGRTGPTLRRLNA